MPKILFFGDVHYSKDSSEEEKRWYPEIVSFLNGFSKPMVRRFLKYCDSYSQRNFNDFLKHIDGKEYDFAICMGDMTPGVNESGLISDKHKNEAKELKGRLEGKLKFPIHFVLGNHDVGFVSNIGYKRGGFSKEALKSASDIYNTEPFYSVPVGDKKIIILTDSLFTYEREFMDLRKEQFKFLKKELAGKKTEAFLVLHSPYSFYDKELKEIIKKNEHKIKAIFFGHVHSSLMKHVAGQALPFYEKIVFVPSVIGFFGFMKFTRGYTELDISNSEYKWKHKKF